MLKRLALPIQLLLVIGIAFVIGPYLPLYAVQWFYTFSLLFKELLSFFLPAIIFSFILSGILSFKKNAPLVVGVLVTLIVASNIIVSMSSFLIGRFFLPLLTTGLSCKGLLATTTIEPLLLFTITPLVRSEHAMLAAIGLGIVFSFYTVPTFELSILRLKYYVELIFNRLFIPLLPF